MQQFNPQAAPQFHGSNPGAPTVGHETSDVNVRAVLAFLAVLAVCGVAVFVICLGIYNAFNRYATKQDGPGTTWTESQDRAEAMKAEELRKHQATTNQIEQSQFESRVESFPQPRLQTDDTRDMQMLRDEEDLQLDNYMWKDRNAGTVVIPIDRAIELTAERGLPSVANSQPAAIREPLTMGVVRVERVSSHDPKQ